MLLVDPRTAPLAYTRRGRRSFLERLNPARCSKKANDSAAKRLHPWRSFRARRRSPRRSSGAARRRPRAAATAPRPPSSGRTSTPSRAPAWPPAAAACSDRGTPPRRAPRRPAGPCRRAPRPPRGGRPAARARRAAAPRARAPRSIRPSRLVDVEHRQRRGAAGRVAGVGRRRGGASGRRGSSKNGAATVVGDDHAAERQVAAGHALGERDHVGPHVLPALDPEPGAEPAEAADHESMTNRIPCSAHRSATPSM